MQKSGTKPWAPACQLGLPTLGPLQSTPDGPMAPSENAAEGPSDAQDQLVIHFIQGQQEARTKPASNRDLALQGAREVSRLFCVQSLPFVRQAKESTAGVGRKI